MTINTTNKMLYSYYQELKQAEGSIFFILLNSRINDFNKINLPKYQTLLKTLDTLQREYFVIEDNKIKTTTDDKGVTTSVLLENKVFDDYQKEYNSIMDTKIILNM